jgi:hypothetical protein
MSLNSIFIKYLAPVLIALTGCSNELEKCIDAGKASIFEKQKSQLETLAKWELHNKEWERQKIQNEVASAASSSRNLQRLIWVPEGFNPKEERQISFLNKLNEGNEGIEGADLIQSSLESFKEILSDKINSIERENKKIIVAKEAKEAKEVVKTVTQSSASSNGSRIIYIISDILDIEEIRPLEDFLFENGCEVVLPIFEGDESLIRSDHIENLKMCDAAIIFYGNANEIWLRSKTRDFLKISGYGRENPLNIKAIYLAGTPSISKERFRSQDSEIINGMNEFPTEILKSLISKL